MVTVEKALQLRDIRDAFAPTLLRVREACSDLRRLCDHADNEPTCKLCELDRRAEIVLRLAGRLADEIDVALARFPLPPKARAAT